MTRFRWLDFLTRPLLVPLYLLAARLSVPFVRWRCVGNVSPGSGGDREGVDWEKLSTGKMPVPPTLAAAAPDGAGGVGEWPAVSIVVPALNAERTITRCLEALGALDYPSERLEIIVADNGSTDGTIEIARGKEARIVEVAKRGAAAARNGGIQAAKHDLVATTDADCIVHPFWLKHLVGVVTDGDCAAAGGRILSFCENPVAREFCTREGVLDQQAAVEGRLLPFPFIITANAVFRREAFGAVGGFDEEFADAAAEDVDLGWRLEEKGFRLGYAADAWAAHRQRERGADIHAQFYRYGLSEVRLYLKHRDRFSRDELSRHLWIRPLLYRHFWKAVVRSVLARGRFERRLARLVVLKELGHMAGKLEGNRRWKTRSYFRLWTNE